MQIYIHIYMRHGGAILCARKRNLYLFVICHAQRIAPRQKATAKQSADNNSGGVKLSITRQAWYFNELLNNCSMTVTRGVQFSVPFSDSEPSLLLFSPRILNRMRPHLHWMACYIVAIRIISIKSQVEVFTNNVSVRLYVSGLHPLCIICLFQRYLKLDGHF